MNSHPRLHEQDTESEAPGGRTSRRVSRRHIAAIALVAGLTAYGAYYEPSHGRTNQAETGEVKAAEGLRDPDTLDRAEQIISTFENSSKKIRYDYAEELDDGRGITAGRAGFTSETDDPSAPSDLLQVVQTYAAMGNDDSPLVTNYLATLEAVSRGDRSMTKDEADGFIEVWKMTAEEQDMKEAQDTVYKELYLYPALKRADKLGINTAIGQTIILDTIIQHGEGTDIDGLPFIIQETIKKAGAVKDQEVEWLNAFLDIRKHHLENAAEPETRKAWRDSVDRVEALRSLLNTDPPNPSLTPPIEWEVYGDKFSITK